MEPLATRESRYSADKTMNRFYLITLVTALTVGSISLRVLAGFSSETSSNSLLVLSDQSADEPCPSSPRGMAAWVSSRTSSSVARVKTQHVKLARLSSNGDSLGRETRPRSLVKGQEEKRSQFAGTAFFFNKNLLVTNYHVVKDTTNFSVVLEDGREFEGVLEGYDADSDLAVISVEGKDLPPGLVIANTVVLGEPVVGIGYPLGLQQSITQGIVSGLNVDSSFVLGDRSVRLLQIDAPINPGNSGGPLFNCLGEVVGVTMAIHPSGQGIAWSISAEEIHRIIPSIAQGKKVPRGYLDVGLSMVPQDRREALRKLDIKPAQNVGVYLFSVDPEGYAAQQGLNSGDIILSIAETNVKNPRQFLRLLAQRSPGEIVTLSILRGSTTMDLEVVLDKRPSNYNHSN